MECDVCSLPGNKDSIFPCDGCRVKCCKGCSKLTASEIKVMQLRERIMKFLCKQCRQFETHKLLLETIEDKNNLIRGRDDIIQILKQKITELEKTKTEPLSKSYSEIAKASNFATQSPPSAIMKNIPSLIIKPKTQQSIEKTKSDVQKINLAELQIGIKTKRTTKNGSYLIKCESKEDVEVLQNKMRNTLQDYEVELTKMKNPRFKIIGYEGKEDKENLEQHIKEQNKFIDEHDMFKITFIKQIRNKQTSTLFGECSPNLFQKLMTIKKVYIGWERYAIYEDIPIQRCFQCQEYSHRITNCPNRIVCQYCSQEHSSKDCPRRCPKKCNNCVNANTKYKLNHDVQHEACDTKCPSYQFLLSVQRSKIDYGTN